MTWAIQKLTLRNSLYENMIALGFLNTEMKAYPSPQPRKKQLPVKYVALSDTEQIFIAAEQRPHPVPKLRKGISHCQPLPLLSQFYHLVQKSSCGRQPHPYLREPTEYNPGRWIMTGKLETFLHPSIIGPALTTLRWCHTRERR